MDPRATPRARPELAVALFNFAEEYASNPERALYQYQLLILDEDTCLARVAFLRTLEGEGPESSRSVRREGERFREETALLCEEGLFAAHAAGRLTPGRVRGLNRLSCDPEALLQVHRRLTERGADPAPAASAPAIPAEDDTPLGGQPRGFTTLVRAGRVADVEDRLRPWLPFLLRRAGLTYNLNEILARQFLAFIRNRLDEVRQRGFRELLPTWLSDFARQYRLSDKLRADRLRPTDADIEADAVERVLRRVGENEPAWAKGFREAALAAKVPNARALLSFAPAETVGVVALPTYRRDLFGEARRRHRDGVELFECEFSA